MVTVGKGADTTKDIRAMELEVRDVATAVMECLIMKVMMVRISLGQGAVPPPSRGHVKKMLNESFFCCLHEVLSLLLREPGNL
jgi:hypothetical protein